MFKNMYPYAYVDSAYDIDYESLYNEGHRLVIYDIDNTLVPHGFPADDRALKLMERLKSIGYAIVFLSNNGKERVEMFNEKIGADYIYKASKPSKKGYQRAMEEHNCDTESTIFVGDQIFTDVWGANRAGIKSFLVKPIDKSTDEIQIVVKRKLEMPIIKAYLKSKEKK